MKRKAFTLVELMVIIIILLILALASYLILGNYTKNTRDGVRIDNFKKIEGLLDEYKMKNGEYPLPYNYQTGAKDASGITWLKGKFKGDEIYKIKSLNYIPIDPNTKDTYTYMVSADGRFYKLVTELESNKKEYIVSNLMSKELALNNTGTILNFNNCTHNGTEINDGEDLIVYRDSSANNCEDVKGKVSCKNGSLSGDTTFTNLTCTDNIAGNCSNLDYSSPNYSPLSYGKVSLSHTTTKTFTKEKNETGYIYIYKIKLSCNNGTIAVIDEKKSLKDCEANYHREGDICIADETKDCDIENGEGYQEWNSALQTWGDCKVKKCNTSYHEELNKCMSDTRDCHPPIENGSGDQSWDSNNEEWGKCNINCDNGYSLSENGESCVIIDEPDNCSGSLYIVNGHNYDSYNIKHLETKTLDIEINTNIENAIHKKCYLDLKCNNGSITDASEQCNLICKSGYHTVGDICEKGTIIANNNPPTLKIKDGYPIAPIEDSTTSSGILVKLVGTDTDGDILTYSLTENPKSYYRIDSSNGNIRLTNAGVSYINLGNNLPKITAQVSDGKGGSDTVERNIPATIQANDAPVFESLNEKINPTKGKAKIGDIVAEAKATDEDGDVLTFSIPNSVNHAGYYSIDSSAGAVETTGTIRLTQKGADLVNSGLNLPSIRVIVSDSKGGEDNKSINITETNETPKIDASIVISPKKETAYILQTVATFEASDGDGDNLEYDIPNNNGLYIILPNEKRVALTQKGVDLINSGNNLPKNFKITATDTRGAVGEAILEIPATTFPKTYKNCEANPNYMYGLFHLYNQPIIKHGITVKLRTRDFGNVINGRRVYELDITCYDGEVIARPPEREMILCNVDYYLEKVDTTPTDGSPVAKISTDRTQLNNSSYVSFYSTGSFDTDGGTIVKYEWSESFGNIDTGSGEILESFTGSSFRGYVSDTKTFSLRVKDNNGKWSKKDSITIFVGSDIPPILEQITCTRVGDGKYSPNDYTHINRPTQSNISPNEKYNCYKPGGANSNYHSTFDISSFTTNGTGNKNSGNGVYDNKDAPGCSWTCTREDYYKNGNYCNRVKNGYYSPTKNNNRYSCDNGPSNSYYTSDGGGSNNCSWKCSSGYHLEGGKCIKNTKPCTIANGTGEYRRTGGWNTGSRLGTCYAKSCNSGWTKRQDEKGCYRRNYSSWGSCSVSCGDGTKYRTATCEGVLGCDSSTKRPTSTSCWAGRCPRNIGSRGSCSVSCGNGTKYRSVTCSGNACTNRPPTSTSCWAGWCSWIKGPWSTCPKKCTTQTQNREVWCSGNKCNYSAKPPTSQSCISGTWKTVQRGYDLCDCSWRNCSWSSSPCGKRCDDGGSCRDRKHKEKVCK